MAAPHNDNIKDKILDGASLLLRERSFADISIADIAESCGVSKGSVYYYYKSKDELLYDIADRYIDHAYNDLMVWVEDEKKDTSLPRLIRYALSRGLNDSGKSLRLHLTMEAIAGNEKLKEKLLAKYDVFRKVFSEKISQRKQGADGNYYAWLILMLIDGLLIQNLLRNSSFNTEEFIEQTVKLLSSEGL